MLISGQPVGPNFKASAPNAVWSPTSKRANLRLNCNFQTQKEDSKQYPNSVQQESTQPVAPPKATPGSGTEEEKSPVWQPFGAPYDGPQFRPIKLGISQTKMTTTLSQNEVPQAKETESPQITQPESPCTERAKATPPGIPENACEPPSTSTAPTIFTKTGWGSHLPPSQSPTITLLQKAREGQIPKGAVYIEEKPDSTPIPKNAVLIDQKVTVEGDRVHTDSYYAVPTLTTETTMHNIKAPPKYDGIGPTEYGIPVGLRTGVKEEYASDWYKTMYKSLHRNKFPNDSSKIVHLGGYMSEPEYDRKDKIKSKYATDYRRKPEKSVSYSIEVPTTDTSLTVTDSVVRHGPEVYRVEPRSISEYEPGKSSLAEKEFQKHEHLGGSPKSQQGLARRWPNVLLSDGYESDSTLIRKTGRNPEVDPDQQKAWYKEIQKGGDIPLTGLRKTAPEKPAEFPNRRFHPNSRDYGTKPPCYDHKHLPQTRTRYFTPSPLSSSNMDAKRTKPTPPKRHSSTIRVPALSHIMHSKQNSNFSMSSTSASCANVFDQWLSDCSPKHRKEFYRCNGSEPRTANPTNNLLKSHHYNDVSSNHSDELRYRYTSPAKSDCSDSNESANVNMPFQSLTSTPRTGMSESCTGGVKHVLKNNFSLFWENECHPRQPKYADAFEVERILAECYDDTFYICRNESTSSEGDNLAGTEEHWAMLKLQKKPRQYHSNGSSAFNSNTNPCAMSSSTQKLHENSSFENRKFFSNCVKTPPMKNSAGLEKQPCFKSNLNFLNTEIVRNTDSVSVDNRINGKTEEVSRNLNCDFSQKYTDVLRLNNSIGRNIHSLTNGSSQFSKKVLPRMITILPPIHVLPAAHVDLKRQVVYSTPQNIKKLHCTSDLKPLQLYLKEYGHLLPGKMENSNLRHSLAIKRILYDFHQEIFDNHEIHRNSNVSRKDSKSFDCFVQTPSMKTLRVLENFTNNHHQISNSKECRIKSVHSKNIQNLPNKNGVACSVFDKTVKSYPNTLSNGSVKSKSNLCLNSQNAIVYHEYIASMLGSASKSRNFVRLKNFYSSLESLSDLSSTENKNAHRYEINAVDISWQNFFSRWDQSLDRSLKIRHSSVEDLRRIFQSSKGKKNVHRSRTTFEMSFQYRRLLYTVSVSNLVERYNKIECFKQSKLPLTFNSRQREFSSKQPHHTHFALEMQRKMASPFGCSASRWQSDSFPVGKTLEKVDHHLSDGSQTCSTTNENALSNNLNDDHDSDGTSQGVQSKVRFFEDATQRKSKLPALESSCFIRKSSLARNSSWCDLRQTDEDFVSSKYSKLFSPSYLPERAMSCLDLSSMSMDSATTDPTMDYCDRASSSTSFLSSECTTTSNDRGIRTGTVSQIRNKLENSLQLSSRTSEFSNSKYCSVPGNLQGVTSNQNRCRHLSSTSFSLSSSRIKSGSVQNLIQKFEPGLRKESSHSQLSLKHGSQRTVNCYDSFLSTFSDKKKSLRNTTNIRISTANEPKISSGMNTFKSKFTSSFDVQGNNKSLWKAFIHQSMKKRIQNLISKFENGEEHTTHGLHGTTSNGPYSHCSTSRHYSTDATDVLSLLATQNSIKWNFPFHIRAESMNINATPPVLNRSGCCTHMNQTERSDSSPTAKKYNLPRIQNSSPRPFVKRTADGRSLMDICTASAHQYQETEVNIHYRSPIRHLEKEYIEEEELRKLQEDAMRKLYEEERRKKQQQELAEIEMRRHSDFFTPSQKSPIPLNRYDNPFESSYLSLTSHSFSRGPPPKTMARALYPFTAQTTRELSLNKGDIVYITKQIDKNWFEGEHHGLVGIFPVSYVEIIPSEKAHLQPKKAIEGEALVKYNFRAQSPAELSLFKGEKVVLMRRLDHNWFEGRLGAKKGIFPISYVEVLQEPGECIGPRTISPKPPASPVFSSLISGSPPKASEGPTFNTGLRPLQSKPPLHLEKSEAKSPLTQSLHIDTYNEPIPYRSLYAYSPQNEDELELREGDTVYVMEKCDDGWYVGTSLRTGLFGTFPGNYVERI
ncbi:hypothetical protein CDAR_81822 [Caerostris darwini]|uniref:Sorbin and SH3 domain-containing protein 1 n=1 Tax=Caerostris darwini TaxID=1538125 RepID=A0AAV4V7H8_9ARAC|nr:hypothetical protein CDAR_81822 [Caerostris darwini]